MAIGPQFGCEVQTVKIMKRKISSTFILTVITCAVAACGGGGGDAKQGAVNLPTTPTVATTTREFPNTGFTEVEIKNSFAFIVQYGDQFGIEVTIDSNYSNLVSVTQEGVRLRVQFDPTFQGDIRAQVARGIVTLPLLETIEMSESAFVDLAGFNQSFLQIAQSGSSHIEGANSRVDFVDATLSGSSHLSLQNFAPLPATNIDTTGNSQATINMMDGATLTGSASGSSNISYYGNSVSQQISTRDTATVTWLGASLN